MAGMFPSPPIRIALLLRDKPQNPETTSSTTALFRTCGLDVRFVPVLAFRRCSGALAMDALRRPEEVSGVAVTSKRALEAVVDLWREIQQSTGTGDVDLARLKDGWRMLPVYVVGSATVQRFSELADDLPFSKSFVRIPPATGQVGGDGGALAEYILDVHPSFKSGFKCPVRPLLFISAQETAGSLERVLGANRLVRVPVYETVGRDYCPDVYPTFSSDLCAAMDAAAVVVLYSPSGVRTLQRACPGMLAQMHQGDGIVVAAIGKTTKSAITSVLSDELSADIGNVVMPSRPDDVEDLVRVVSKALSRQREC